MRKFILYIILSLFIAQNVYSDTRETGRCIGYLVAKMMNEGQSSLTQPNLKWMRANNNDIQTVNKIQKEQKNCIAQVTQGQSYKHCLSGYSNYDAQLYIEMNHGSLQYNQYRYDQARRALIEMVCSNY